MFQTEHGTTTVIVSFDLGEKRTSFLLLKFASEQDVSEVFQTFCSTDESLQSGL